MWAAIVLVLEVVWALGAWFLAKCAAVSPLAALLWVASSAVLTEGLRAPGWVPLLTGAVGGFGLNAGLNSAGTRAMQARRAEADLLLDAWRAAHAGQGLPDPSPLELLVWHSHRWLCRVARVQLRAVWARPLGPPGPRRPLLSLHPTAPRAPDTVQTA